MKCYICQKSAREDGIVLYRQNEKGVPGVWACLQHSKPVEKDVEEAVEISLVIAKGLAK